MPSFRLDIFAVLVVIAIQFSADAFEGGAPGSSCRTLLPGHGRPVQLNNRLMLNKPIVNEGEILKVELQGNWQGIMMQARINGAVIGTWQNLPPQTKVRRCSADGDTVTQSTDSDKTTTTFEWIAPPGVSGNVNIMATVLSDKHSFMQLTAGPIQIVAAGPPAPPGPPATPGPTDPAVDPPVDPAVDPAVDPSADPQSAQNSAESNSLSDSLSASNSVESSAED